MFTTIGFGGKLFLASPKQVSSHPNMGLWSKNGTG
jgi:hypothetical protein